MEEYYFVHKTVYNDINNTIKNSCIGPCVTLDNAIQFIKKDYEYLKKYDEKSEGWHLLFYSHHPIPVDMKVIVSTIKEFHYEIYHWHPEDYPYEERLYIYKYEIHLATDEVPLILRLNGKEETDDM